VKDVVTVRPSYAYPAVGNPVPALVVAVTPGTPSRRPSCTKFGVAFAVTEATVEEQRRSKHRSRSACRKAHSFDV
jgi:hypothetical protein